MNTAAANLLQSLDQLGVQTITFRILGVGRALRHTSPITLPLDAAALRALSITELFAAYSISPRQGSYELNVETGCLAFHPAIHHSVARKTARLSLLKKRRVRSKSGSPRVNATFLTTHHKIAA